MCSMSACTALSERIQVQTCSGSGACNSSWARASPSSNIRRVPVCVARSMMYDQSRSGFEASSSAISQIQPIRLHHRSLLPWTQRNNNRASGGNARISSSSRRAGIRCSHKSSRSTSKGKRRLLMRQCRSIWRCCRDGKNCTRARNGSFVLPYALSPVLEGAPLVTVRYPEAICRNDIPLPYNYIQIPEFAQCDIAIGKGSEGGSLVGNRADARGFQMRSTLISSAVSARLRLALAV